MRQVLLQLAPVGRDDEPVRSGQPLHVGQQRVGRAGDDRQTLGDHPFVGAPGDCGMPQQRLRLGREQHDIAAVVIVERLLRHDVAGAEQTAVDLIPDGEREVSEQVGRAVDAPPPVGGQGERRIERRGQRQPRALELFRQRRTVVDAAVEHDCQVLVGGDVRLVFTDRFRRGGQQAVAEADRTARPDPRRVGPAIRNRREHARDEAAVGRPPVEVEEADDPAHGLR